MKKIIIKIIKNPTQGTIFLLLFFIILPIFISIIFGTNLFEKLKIYFALSLFMIVFSELAFRILYRLFNGEKYNFPIRIPFEKIHVEPHPYIPYIYKKDFTGPPSERLNYDLNNSFFSSELKTNNLGFYNGEKGNRSIEMPKPNNLYRINCIGGSTTGNYIFFENKNCSYPLELEKILKNKLNKEIEVNNCGEGGYNSADLLVRFALQIIDTKPDMIVIYHAYNDGKSYLTPEFKSDYSHSRINLGNVYWKLKVGLTLSYIPLKFFNYLVNKWFPYNMRNSLLEIVSKKEVNFNEIDIDFDISEGLKIYERNLQHIIDLCRTNKIKVVISTYCFNLHEKIKNKNLHILYKKIVAEENKVAKKLAIKNNVIFVDSALQMPLKEDLFVDSVHFSPNGMKQLAKIISEKILETNELLKP